MTDREEILEQVLGEINNEFPEPLESAYSLTIIKSAINKAIDLALASKDSEENHIETLKKDLKSALDVIEVKDERIAELEQEISKGKKLLNYSEEKRYTTNSSI